MCVCVCVCTYIYLLAHQSRWIYRLIQTDKDR